ncbi:hypothetical protein BDZ97DRAFT_2078841 [Flammula alnicola]|nr:hypothetical protein BDZ97DRAFT_2078841 [Flammula alnicola]
MHQLGTATRSTKLDAVQHCAGAQEASSGNQLVFHTLPAFVLTPLIARYVSRINEAMLMVLTSHLVLRLRGSMQTFVKALTGKIITLEVGPVVSDQWHPPPSLTIANFSNPLIAIYMTMSTTMEGCPVIRALYTCWADVFGTGKKVVGSRTRRRSAPSPQCDLPSSNRLVTEPRAEMEASSMEAEAAQLVKISLSGKSAQNGTKNSLIPALKKNVLALLTTPRPDKLYSSPTRMSGLPKGHVLSDEE